ncbi:MAG: NHLP bacteriocin system secretion protein [Moorea sp. SIO4G2]|nr:NHLP bacteriocin system secretion protein [Moorena sp. SIO4G2]
MKPKKKSNLFREESVEHLTSPEKLDQAMEVVSRQDWLPLSTLAGIVFLTIIWSIVGKLPLTIKSKGVLIHPHKVVEVQSPVSGQLEQINIKEGDCVDRGFVLATIEPSDIQQKLQQQKERLTQLQSQSQLANTLQVQRTNLEVLSLQQKQEALEQSLQNSESLNLVLNNQAIEAIKQQKESIQQKITDLQTITPTLREKGLNSIKEQRVSIFKQLNDFKELSSSLKDRVEKRRELVQAGAISLDQILEAEQSYKQNLQNISKLEAELKQLDVKEAEVEQQYLDNLSTISKHQAELRELTVNVTETREKYLKNMNQVAQQKTDLKTLATERKKLEQQNLEDSSKRENQIQQVKYDLAQLSKQYNDNQAIKSPYSGCFLNITASKGSVIDKGFSLGVIQRQSSSDSLSTVAYFPVGQGKKIKPGMKIYVTPDTVRREKFGSIIGTVSEVSPFPITQQGATKLIGNSTIAENLASKVRPVIEIHGKLQADSSTPSGYAWSSSQGPSLTVTSGTTVTVQVTIEEQTPITLVLPILRQLSGIY